LSLSRACHWRIAVYDVPPQRLVLCTSSCWHQSKLGKLEGRRSPQFAARPATLAVEAHRNGCEICQPSTDMTNEPRTSGTDGSDSNGCWVRRWTACSLLVQSSTECSRCIDASTVNTICTEHQTSWQGLWLQPKSQRHKERLVRWRCCIACVLCPGWPVTYPGPRQAFTFMGNEGSSFNSVWTWKRRRIFIFNIIFSKL